MGEKCAGSINLSIQLKEGGIDFYVKQKGEASIFVQTLIKPNIHHLHWTNTNRVFQMWHVSIKAGYEKRVPMFAQNANGKGEFTFTQNLNG